VISSLDHFKEESRSIFEWPREELKEVAFFIIINEDLMLLKNVNVLFNLKSSLGKTLSQLVIVCVWNFLKEFNSTIFHSRHSFYDIFCAHRNVLNSSASIIVTILLDLTLFHSIRWLVDWHFNLLVEINHDNRA